MRITVDIAPSTLKKIMSLTKEGKKSPAVAKALDEYIRREKLKNFGQLIKSSFFNFPLTNRELEDLDR